MKFCFLITSEIAGGAISHGLNLKVAASFLISLEML